MPGSLLRAFQDAKSVAPEVFPPGSKSRVFFFELKSADRYYQAEGDFNKFRRPGATRVMAFNYRRCRDIILEGILAGIKLCAEEIAVIAREARVTGISLDLVPWHSALGISIRQVTENAEHVRHCNVEWGNFDV